LEPPTADEALERLRQGNERFRADRTEGSGRVSSRRKELVEGQSPFAIILGCSDSRVPPSAVFDSGLGDLFVVRVAGNVANTSSIASIEYAIAQLGTRLIVVMAHQSCGAVTAAMEGGDAGKNLNTLMGYIRPALEPPERDVDVVARRNARNSAQRIIDESDIIRKAVEGGDAKMVTAFFHLSTGEVEFD
jgi:carbonic anhydrase